MRPRSRPGSCADVVRGRKLLESLTGGAPAVGFVHGLLARTAGLLGAVHDRIRTLITLAYEPPRV